MIEFRCKFCKKLLANFYRNEFVSLKGEESLKNPYSLAIEIKCSKCKTVNIINYETLTLI